MGDLSHYISLFYYMEETRSVRKMTRTDIKR